MIICSSKSPPVLTPRTFDVTVTTLELGLIIKPMSYASSDTLRPMVADVTASSQCDVGGVQIGDVVVSMNGVRFASFEDFCDILSNSSRPLTLR